MTIHLEDIAVIALSMGAVHAIIAAALRWRTARSRASELAANAAELKRERVLDAELDMWEGKRGGIFGDLTGVNALIDDEHDALRETSRVRDVTARGFRSRFKAWWNRRSGRARQIRERWFKLEREVSDLRHELTHAQHEANGLRRDLARAESNAVSVILDLSFWGEAERVFRWDRLWLPHVGRRLQILLRDGMWTTVVVKQIDTRLQHWGQMTLVCVLGPEMATESAGKAEK